MRRAGRSTTLVLATLAVVLVVALIVAFFEYQTFPTNGRTEKTGANIHNGGAVVDQTVTGVRVTISGSSAADGTAFTVTSTVFGTSPPGEITAARLAGAQYFDVLIAGLATGSTRVCISVTTPATAMQYWRGSAWTNATVISSTSSATCGNILVASLRGTAIVIGT